MAERWSNAGDEPRLEEIYSDSLFALILKRDRLQAEDVKALVARVQARLKANRLSNSVAFVLTWRGAPTLAGLPLQPGLPLPRIA
jgi:hypothetical protein|tara:strand:+ start:893 stop:1147 length:255 start_codon:yes stop_codon:yes gene_type:complete